MAILLNLVKSKCFFVIFSQNIIVNMILCSMYNYVTMSRFIVIGCHRKTAACHVTDPLNVLLYLMFYYCAKLHLLLPCH